MVQRFVIELSANISLRKYEYNKDSCSGALLHVNSLSTITDMINILNVIIHIICKRVMVLHFEHN